MTDLLDPVLVDDGQDDPVTLRDALAALAMQGMLARDGMGNLGPAGVADAAYVVANEMLKRRSRK